MYSILLSRELPLRENRSREPARMAGCTLKCEVRRRTSDCAV